MNKNWQHCIIGQRSNIRHWIVEVKQLISWKRLQAFAWRRKMVLHWVCQLYSTPYTLFFFVTSSLEGFPLPSTSDFCRIFVCFMKWHCNISHHRCDIQHFRPAPNHHMVYVAGTFELVLRNFGNYVMDSFLWKYPASDTFLYDNSGAFYG